MRKGLRTAAWMIFVSWVTVAALGGVDRKPSSPLSRRLDHFKAENLSAVEALLQVGLETRVCFGIEFSGSELSREVLVEANQVSVGELVSKILGRPHDYQVSVSSGVVLIRKHGAKPPAWLNHVLPRFDTPRVHLAWAGTMLWMELERDLGPRDQGFAGDGPPGDPTDLIGPFHERGKTVRQLLNEIVVGSKGGMWLVTGQALPRSRPAGINRFWTLVLYSD